MQVGVLPGVPILTGMWFNPNSRGSRLRIWQPWGCKSLHAHQVFHCVKNYQNSRSEFCRRVVNREQQTDSAQTRTALGVQVSPRRPAFVRIPHCAHRATARHAIFGMPTGQANRVSLLTSACLRASGASPRHSAIIRARSSKRTVRLISGIALDECLDPERYRTRAPAFVPPAGRDYGSAGHFEPLNAK